jgi:hypothetical protein
MRAYLYRECVLKFNLCFAIWTILSDAVFLEIPREEIEESQFVLIECHLLIVPFLDAHTPGKDIHEFVERIH